MFTLWKYIIKEHISPFIFAISVITLVFLLNLVFRELGRILSKGLGFSLILEFFFLNMAWIIALAVPMAVLVATLMAFGRLSGDSEITAMKAGGVGIMHMIFPVLIVSFFLAGFLVWFNNYVLPDFNHRTRLLASDIARKRPTVNLEPGVVMKDIPDINILVQKLKEAPDTSYVETIFIEDNRTKNKSKYIFARKGKIYSNPRSGYMFMTLYDGEMHELDLEKMEQYTRLTFPQQKLSISIPNMNLERSDSEYRGDREKSAQMTTEEVRENKGLLNERNQRIDQLISSYFERHIPLTDPPDVKDKPVESKIFPDKLKTSTLTKRKYIEKIRQDNLRTRQQISAEMNIIKNYERSNYTLMVEVHKKYSIPFACIVFVLVGAPLGIMARKGNLAVAGGISFGFFLLYWASLIAGEELADNQIISPFIAMWLADIIVGAGGVYLVIHSIHESTFINWTSIQDFFLKIPNLFKNKTKTYDNIR